LTPLTYVLFVLSKSITHALPFSTKIAAWASLPPIPLPQLDQRRFCESLLSFSEDVVAVTIHLTLVMKPTLFLVGDTNFTYSIDANRLSLDARSR
jgi:hypothetical protein